MRKTRNPTEQAARRMIGDRLRDARGTISQGDVAEALGIPRTAYVDIEAGRRSLRFREAVLFVEYLHRMRYRFGAGRNKPGRRRILSQLANAALLATGEW